MQIKKTGFTLIELLVVIAIIGILATLAVLSLTNARRQARDAKRVSDIRQIRTALDLYLNDKNKYPAQIENIILGSGSYDILCDTTAGFQSDEIGCGVTYLEIVPANQGQGGANYVYSGSADGGTYSITFNLEGQIGSLVAGDHTANQSNIQ